MQAKAIVLRRWIMILISILTVRNPAPKPSGDAGFLDFGQDPGFLLQYSGTNVVLIWSFKIVVQIGSNPEIQREIQREKFAGFRPSKSSEFLSLDF